MITFLSVAARVHADVLEEEPGVEEADDNNVQEEGQRVEVDDKMGAKVG